MLEALFNFIIKLFFWIMGIIGSIIIYPIQALIVTIIPQMGEYVAIALNFFSTQVFPMMSFAKELFLDYSCMPRPVFALLVTFLITKWAIAPAIRSILFIINVFRLYKGGITINLNQGTATYKP